MPTRITEGSGTSAQITGLLASTKPAADEELTALDDATELFEETIALVDDATTLLDNFELALIAVNDELDERNEETVTEDIATDEADVDVPHGAPWITGISAAAEPLVPWKPNSTD